MFKFKNLSFRPRKLLDKDEEENLFLGRENLNTQNILDNTSKIDDTSKIITPNSNLDPNLNRENSQENQNSSNSSFKKKAFKNFSLGKLLSLILIVSFLFFFSLTAWLAYDFFFNIQAKTKTETITKIENTDNTDLNNNNNLLSFLPEIKGIITNEIVPLKGEREGRTNVLLLGIDKEASLTDTIILMSFYHQEKKIVTVNIPRDLYVNDGFITEKINAIYPAAKARRPQSKSYASNFLANFLNEELDIPIHYWATINFQGLVDIIDALGGVQVKVENYFQDCEYPKMDYSGYLPCQTFKPGLQTMDGNRALIYARSRKSLDNNEGTDFARSRRQSILIQAILNKIKSLGLGNLGKINSYLQILEKNVLTNASSQEILSGINKLRSLEIQNNFEKVVWDTENTKFLCDGTNDFGSYVITYCDGSYLGDQNNFSKDKQAAREEVKNLLQTARLQKIYNSSVLIVGSQQQIINDVSLELQNIGFQKITSKIYTNDNKQKFSKITVFITDKEKYDTFRKINFKNNPFWKNYSFEYVNSSIQEDLAPKNEKSEIVIKLS